MAGADPELLVCLAGRIRAALAAQPGRMLVAGLCGAQGSGKTTLAAALEKRLGEEGIPAARLSLDDIYLTRAERQRLARDVHPLFATRGAPGTHDVALGLETIASLDLGDPAPLPRFDKGADDRAPQETWPRAPADTRVLLLEGWCLGARPQPDVALDEPANALERAEDPAGVWRRHANAMLAGDYLVLFARVDFLILLAAPGWEAVEHWREEQEEELRARGGPKVMSSAQVRRFIQHYERLTRWILAEMPGRADMVVRLDRNRRTID